MKRIVVKEEVCIACKFCEVYCVVQHSKSKDIIKAFKKESPRPNPRVRVEEAGPVSFGFQCRHCEEPSCVMACVSGAMTKGEDGTVRCDEAKCIGCWTCVLSCPYGAISRDSAGGHDFALKCDLCPGLETPACVANCPNEALKLVEEREAS